MSTQVHLEGTGNKYAVSIRLTPELKTKLLEAQANGTPVSLSCPAQSANPGQAVLSIGAQQVRFNCTPETNSEVLAWPSPLKHGSRCQELGVVHQKLIAPKRLNDSLISKLRASEEVANARRSERKAVLLDGELPKKGKVTKGSVTYHRHTPPPAAKPTPAAAGFGPGRPAGQQQQQQQPARSTTPTPTAATAATVVAPQPPAAAPQPPQRKAMEPPKPNSLKSRAAAKLAVQRRQQQQQQQQQQPGAPVRTTASPSPVPGAATTAQQQPQGTKRSTTPPAPPAAPAAAAAAAAPPPARTVSRASASPAVSPPSAPSQKPAASAPPAAPQPQRQPPTAAAVQQRHSAPPQQQRPPASAAPALDPLTCPIPPEAIAAAKAGPRVDLVIFALVTQHSIDTRLATQLAARVWRTAGVRMEDVPYQELMMAIHKVAAVSEDRGMLRPREELRAQLARELQQVVAAQQQQQEQEQAAPAAVQQQQLLPAKKRPIDLGVDSPVAVQKKQVPAAAAAAGRSSISPPGQANQQQKQQKRKLPAAKAGGILDLDEPVALAAKPAAAAKAGQRSTPPVQEPKQQQALKRLKRDSKPTPPSAAAPAQRTTPAASSNSQEAASDSPAAAGDAPKRRKLTIPVERQAQKPQLQQQQQPAQPKIGSSLLARPQHSSETMTTATTRSGSPSMQPQDSETAALVARLADASPETDPDEHLYRPYIMPVPPPVLPIRSAQQYRQYKQEFESCYGLYIQLHEKIEHHRAVYLSLEQRLLGAKGESERSHVRSQLRSTHARRSEMLDKVDKAFKNLHKHLSLLKQGVQGWQAAQARLAAGGR